MRYLRFLVRLGYQGKRHKEAERIHIDYMHGQGIGS